jgi:acetyl-CoA C-acetyltransferase
MPKGICDKVAIVAAGCSCFGERWDCSAEDLMQEAFADALASRNLPADIVDAAWVGISLEEHSIGKSALAAASALRLTDIPVTRVENLCASGTEAMRAAAYAVAAGASEVALAIGVEKLKDTGYAGLPERSRGVQASFYTASFSAPGAFAQLADAYRHRHGLSRDRLRSAMAHVPVKSHDNATKNPRAHLRRPITVDEVLSAPIVADPLGVLDCCGVSDGAACAIVTTPEYARSIGIDDFVTIKAIEIVASSGVEAQTDRWDGSYFHTTRVAARRAYESTGIIDAGKQLGLLEVHDCFSVTELVTMEDLGVSPEGTAVFDVEAGRFDIDGEIPCQSDGGLKCFGHPVGASGLRMIFEIYEQLRGTAGDRQILHARPLGLTHNLGGHPWSNVCSIAILGGPE